MTLRSRARLILLLATAMAPFAGCGNRGDPTPPLRPQPPTIAGVTVAQRGATAVVRFTPPPPTMEIDRQTVEVAAIELLTIAERYPVLTADMISAVLVLERRRRLKEAEVAAAEAAAIVAARQQAEAEALLEQQAAAGAVANINTEDSEELPASDTRLPADEHPPADETTDDTTAEYRASGGVQSDGPAVADAEGSEEPTDDEGEELTAEELLLREVPNAVLREWRAAGVREDVLVEGARRLDEAMDGLWDELGLPNAIVARGTRPALPEPPAIIEAATRLLERSVFERPLTTAVFLERAIVARVVPFGELGSDLTQNTAEIVQPVGIPSSGPARTRYFFAVRAVSERGQEGLMTNVVSLAPSPVPTPPGAIQATVIEAGVQLAWSAPAGDLWGREHDPATLRYNVYRSVLDGPASTTLLTPRPVGDLAYSDSTIEWGRRYSYEVRALMAPTDPVLELAGSPPAIEGVVPPPRPKKEGAGSVTGEIEVVDSFPPDVPTELRADRVGRRVTLRWTASIATDVAGYRVYRHPVPAPLLPVAPNHDTTDEAATPSPPGSEVEATSLPEAQTETDAVHPAGETEAESEHLTSAESQNNTEAKKMQPVDAAATGPDDHPAAAAPPTIPIDSTLEPIPQAEPEGDAGIPAVDERAVSTTTAAPLAPT